MQISKVLTKDVEYIQGVNPIDLLPSTHIKPSIIVVILDKHYTPGSHLVALCFFDSGYAKYFDSYGLPTYKLEIMSYLKNHSISWTFNHQSLQVLTSKVGGYYCCLYAFHRARGLSMTLFPSMFSPARYRCNVIRAVRMLRAQFGNCPACSQLEHQQQSCKSQV